MKLYFSLICSVILATISCSLQNDPNPQIYLDRFYNNSNRFTTLLNLIKADTVIKGRNGATVSATQLSNSIKGQMLELGVRDVFVDSWDNQEFDFMTNWKNTYPIHLIYRPLDSIKTRKGYYEKNYLGNEIWGLGNGWGIYIAKKLVDGIQ